MKLDQYLAIKRGSKPKDKQKGIIIEHIFQLLPTKPRLTLIKTTIDEKK